MDKEEYLAFKEQIIRYGYGNEIKWATNLTKCLDITRFISEYICVVINSGMKAQIASIIIDRVFGALKAGTDLHDAFRHKGKVNAILYVLANQKTVFNEYFLVREDLTTVLPFLGSLPYIGKITKFHLARNLGFDCIKPDRHLVRIAKQYNLSPEKLCENLSNQTGDRLGVVDAVLWRCANQQLI